MLVGWLEATVHDFPQQYSPTLIRAYCLGGVIGGCWTSRPPFARVNKFVTPLTLTMTNAMQRECEEVLLPHRIVQRSIVSSALSRHPLLYTIHSHSASPSVVAGTQW